MRALDRSQAQTALLLFALGGLDLGLALLHGPVRSGAALRDISLGPRRSAVVCASRSGH